MDDCMTQEDAMNMNDEQAVDILKALMLMMVDHNGCPISDVYFALDKAIEALSAQPDVPDTNVGDMISRQVAIDELIAMREHIDARMSVVGCTAYEMAIEALREPEIIRCKDCTNWDTTWTNDWTPNYHYCPIIDGVRKDDFYCADAERRTDEADYRKE